MLLAKSVGGIPNSKKFCIIKWILITTFSSPLLQWFSMQPEASIVAKYKRILSKYKSICSNYKSTLSKYKSPLSKYKSILLSTKVYFQSTQVYVPSTYKMFAGTQPSEPGTLELQNLLEPIEHSILLLGRWGKICYLIVLLGEISGPSQQTWNPRRGQKLFNGFEGHGMTCSCTFSKRSKSHTIKHKTWETPIKIGGRKMGGLV